MRTILTGALATILLQVLVSNPIATDTTGGLLAFPAQFARHFLSPDVPAIPDLRKPTQATTPAASQPAAPVNPWWQSTHLSPSFAGQIAQAALNQGAS